MQLYSLEALKLGFFIPWIRIRDPPNFDGSGSLAEKLADPGGSGSETLIKSGVHIELIDRFLATKYHNWQIFSDKISKLADF